MRTRGKKLARVGATGAASLGLLFGCAAPEETPAKNPPSRAEMTWETVADEGYVLQEAGRVALSGSNVCAWAPSSPQPQPDRHHMQVDARCLAENPGVSDSAAPAYALLEDAAAGQAAFHVPTGTEVEAECYIKGSPVTDQNGATSTIKVAIRTPEGKQGLLDAASLGYALGRPVVCPDAKLAEIAASHAP